MTRRSTSGPIWSDLSTPAPSPQLSPDKRHDRRRGTRAGHRPGEPDRSLDWGSLWARSGVAPPAHPAARAGSTLLRFGAHALGRLGYAVLRNEDSVCAGIQAAHVRRRNLVSDAGPRGGHGEHGRNRVADSARVRPPHPLGGARPFVHDRNHPAHLPGRLGELPSVLGGDGARDPHLWPRRDFPRPAHWPRWLERKAPPERHRGSAQVVGRPEVGKLGKEVAVRTYPVSLDLPVCGDSHEGVSRVGYERAAVGRGSIRGAARFWPVLRAPRVARPSGRGGGWEGLGLVPRARLRPHRFG